MARPADATARSLYDHLDFTYAYRAFMDTMRGVSIRALRQGHARTSACKKNEVIVFSKLMDAKLAVPHRQRRHDLRHGLASTSPTGPVVIESPPELPRHRRRTAWFRWVTDLGCTGA